MSPLNGLLLLAIFLNGSVFLLAELADYDTVPKGTNPTLYKAGKDRIVQLDVNTFNDTIFCTDSSVLCTSYVVEFYSDWCGHCRAYAPLYRALSHDIYSWNSVIKVAAINCADPVNELICRANGVMFFPFLKYFPRNSTDPNFSVKLKPFQSLSALRDQITQILVQDYAINHFIDWPNFDYLGDISHINELWQGSPAGVESAAVVFDSEANSLIGAQLLLDLSQHAGRIVVRRSIRAHPLAELLHIVDFPTLAIFRRGEEAPVLVTELRRLLLSEIDDYLLREKQYVGRRFGSHKNQSEASAAAIVEEKCAKNSEDCVKLYYVSESDMLKAMHYALVREVSRSGAQISGANHTALRNFVDLLATHFPYHTISSAQSSATLANEGTLLDSSSRAYAVFIHMRDFLDSHVNESISVNDWQAEFNKSEEEQKRPFPEAADWEHCKGSSPEFRGYTCGLWTAFHALTVTAYRNSHGASFRPIPVLHAIRDWVANFFGCENCQKHFIKMTTKTAKIEARVRKEEDVFLYLWKIHNMVNARLRNRETEDPNYPKFQFPAPFLCPECRHNNGVENINGTDASSEFDENVVRDYLLKFYSNIKPIKLSE